MSQFRVVGHPDEMLPSDASRGQHPKLRVFAPAEESQIKPFNPLALTTAETSVERNRSTLFTQDELQKQVLSINTPLENPNSAIQMAGLKGFGVMAVGLFSMVMAGDVAFFDPKIVQSIILASAAGISAWIVRGGYQDSHK